MKQGLTDSRLANLGANTIHQAFAAYQKQFDTLTRQARWRFENQDWLGMQADAAERLDLYKNAVDRILLDIHKLLGERRSDKLIWAGIKAVYSGLIASRDDWGLAETFFNSVTRRIFATVGVDPQIEFVDTDFETPPTPAKRPVYRTYERAASTVTLVEAILKDYRFGVVYQDLPRDAKLAAAEVEIHLRDIGALRVVERAEMIEAVFYRGQGAYLVGRVFSGTHLIPFVLALLNTPAGIVVDAVLLNENEVSILFSFTRSYFHVEVERPYDLVRFLKTIMPRKRVPDLYISIGYNKQGKTELYRDLLHHLASSIDRFEIAPGARGMVMLVFAMPAYDMVFKVIKDEFPPPKETTRAAVMAKYHLVFKHDRAGRLVDAQEFEHLKFERWRFSEALLHELQNSAAETVVVDEKHVVIKHLYVERQVMPLNIYLRETDEAVAVAAVMDYGHAIKDLAASGIFPGDLLLKNFGVTRHGRVVFYDYDELCLLPECNFRVMPPSQSYEEEISAEPWFAVRDNDIFPEEFERFLGLQGKLREIFLAHHADLFDPQFWQQHQARLRAGEVMHIFPYAQSQRLFEKA
jgi:isocitrate dehydrogenase kinase/phosphatase